MDAAARCELALCGIVHPTPEQAAGATLRAHQANDIRKLRAAYAEEK